MFIKGTTESTGSWGHLLATCPANIAGTRRKVSHGIISFEAVYFCIEMCLFTGRQNEAFQFFDAIFTTVFPRQELCFRTTACRVPIPGMFNEACLQWRTRPGFCVHVHKVLMKFIKIILNKLIFH